MLVLTRKVNESLRIGDAVVKVQREEFNDDRI